MVLKRLGKFIGCFTQSKLIQPLWDLLIKIFIPIVSTLNSAQLNYLRLILLKILSRIEVENNRQYYYIISQAFFPRPSSDICFTVYISEG